MLVLGCKSQSKSNQKRTELKQTINSSKEQENYRIQEFFKRIYEKQSYSIYPKEIKEITIDEIEWVNETKFIYDDKSFKIYEKNETLKLILKKGILYPQLFSGFSTELRKSDNELDSLSVSDRAFYEMSRGDNLTISNLEELKFLSESPKIKRFRFWVMFPKTTNAREYMIELTNENADKNTELKEFIENSKLTFLKMSNIII
ncbi:hypothetical protein C1T31_09250 [Hanstruepera neustonica]|uniref:Uncharacterized protein n=2 Tax=Hanstruepera neustonica TaxID=1445657 RepID=A0A2K1DXX8_9FLAO|nr:hypothetical protein C1T31_09250 [Hanstruepera neustonica]